MFQSFGLDGDGELLLVVEPRVEERPLAAHLRDGDVGVPVGDGAPAGLGVVVHPGLAEGGGQQGGGRLPVRAKGLAVVQAARRRTSPAPRRAAPSSARPRRCRADPSGASGSGASVMILPTSRSRLGQPSSRRPMPGAKASSTVEWQMAQVMPTDLRASRPRPKKPFTPTTASSLSRATVVAGSSRSTCFCLQLLHQVRRAGRPCRP